MTQPTPESAEVPIHKATDGTEPIKSLCQPGFYQLAEQWENVTCRACLVYSPEVTT